MDEAVDEDEDKQQLEQVIRLIEEKQQEESSKQQELSRKLIFGGLSLGIAASIATIVTAALFLANVITPTTPIDLSKPAIGGSIIAVASIFVAACVITFIAQACRTPQTNINNTSEPQAAQVDITHHA